MAYTNSNDPGRLMDDEYEAVIELQLDRQRKRHAAATLPRTGFDGEILFGKYPPRARYETAQERQLREAAERHAENSE